MVAALRKAQPLNRALNAKSCGDQLTCKGKSMAMEEMMKHPAPFLEIRVSDFEAEPWLVAMCAGYEKRNTEDTHQ
ncbi:MAG: hypothetical protein ACI8VC_002682 [Candidatus Endobugula sp.]